MKYVVTGGAGFIGSHLTAALLEMGHDVVVIDDLFSGKRENLQYVEANLQAESPGTLRFVEASILDRESVRAAVDGATAVLHQAAIASVPRSFADPAPTLRVNIEGTTCLLEACRDAGIRRFVMASSSSVYGDTPTLPKHEAMTPNPMSPYALSKLVDEQLLAMWASQYDMETAGLRYFNVFGPRQDPNSDYAAVIPKFITAMLAGERPRIYGDGTQSRDFTFIDNVVQVNLLAAGVLGDAGHVPAGEAFNVGVGTRFTLLDLVQALNEILGTSLEPEFEPRRTGDVMHSLAAIDRAGDLLGYRPTVDFRAGLERTVAWYADVSRADVARTA